jgi:Fe-S cluster biogenesis protein NfuA
VRASQPAPPPEVVAALNQLDELVQLFAQHPDEGVQEAVVGLLRAVDVLHRGVLQRLGAFLDERSLLDEALADPHVALLFALYGTEDGDYDDERSRAEAAVARIRPEVEAHGGRLEVVTAEGGVVNIRLGGDSSSGSTATLRRMVQEALRAELPEFVRMDLSSAPRKPEAAWEPTPVVIPLSSLSRRGRLRPSPGASGSTGHGRSSCG